MKLAQRGSSFLFFAAIASCSEHRTAPAVQPTFTATVQTVEATRNSAPIAPPALVAPPAVQTGTVAAMPAPMPAGPTAAPAARRSAGAGVGRGEGEIAIARDERGIRVDQLAQAPARMLTAASVGDTDRRGNYLEYLSRHLLEREQLNMDMRSRVRFQVLDREGNPVTNARIAFNVGNRNIEGRTHADGWWDFYPTLVGVNGDGQTSVSVDVSSGNFSGTGHFVVPQQGDASSSVVLRIDGVAGRRPTVLDLGFVIDVTGSMGDELRFVSNEIGHIVERVQREVPGVVVRVGASFYRDRGDATEQNLPFSTDVQSFATQMRRVTASGGGDYPEDMNSGLDSALHGLNWTDGDAIRVLVVIADAPPQHYPHQQFTWRDATLEASRRGVRLLPVAASGADRTVEYLFRAMGAATSTPYVYLTDDSGIGGHHMEADTDRVGVERFNDLLTRLVVSDLRGEGMHEPGALARE